MHLILFDEFHFFLLEKQDYLAEYHLPFVRAWQTTHNYKVWTETVDVDILGMINPGHPFHGYSAIGEMSARLTEMGKNALQSNLKAFSGTQESGDPQKAQQGIAKNFVNVVIVKSKSHALICNLNRNFIFECFSVVYAKEKGMDITRS